MMAIDFKKLEETCRAAKVASEAAGKSEDGGACNFDSVFIRLPRVKEEKVLAALNAGGLRGYKTKHFGSIGFIVIPTGCGQGNSRTRAMEAMLAVFKGAGFDASGWYQMD
jgi:hypothetical protein